LKRSLLEETLEPKVTINDEGYDEDGYQLRLPTEGAHVRQQRLSKMQRLVQVAHLDIRKSTKVKLTSEEGSTIPLSDFKEEREADTDLAD
jgi:hypothetical protein